MPTRTFRKTVTDARGKTWTYAVDGRQFVVFAVGNPEVPAELVAVSLED